MLSAVFFYSAVSVVDSLNLKNWRGYHILLAEKNDATPLVYSKLKVLSLFDEVLSEYNATVEYTDYNNLEYITIANLEKRFNSRDPRFDSFMQKAGSYFRGNKGLDEYSVFYLKTEADYDIVKNAVTSVLGSGTDWLMPEGETPFFNPAAFALFIIILSVFIYLERKNAFLYLLHSSPWLFVIFCNGRAYFFPSVVMLFVLRYALILEKALIDEYINTKAIDITKRYNKKLFFTLAVIFFSFIFSSLLTGGKWIALFTVLFLIFFDIFLIFSRFLYSFLRVSGYCHNVFISVPIKKRETEKKIFSMPVPVFWAVYLLSAAIIPLYFMNAGSGISYPVPVHIQKYPDGDVTLDYIKKLAEKKSFGYFLPDYSDYIRHLAYQTRLPYRSDYTVPYHNENISISHYFSEKNNFRKEKTIVSQFTDQWLMDNITIGKERGLTGLLICSEGFIQAATGNISPAAPLVIPAIFSFLYPLALCLIFGSNKSQKTGCRRNIIPLIKRRKQQAA